MPVAMAVGTREESARDGPACAGQGSCSHTLAWKGGGSPLEGSAMSLLLILLILIIVLGGGGFYAGGPRVGGSLAGILLIVLIVLALTGRL